MTVIETERLILRTWTAADTPAFFRINQDPKVIEHLPGPITMEEIYTFIRNCNRCFTEKQFCLFAAEEKETPKLIGFIGLSIPRFEAHFTPAVEIGWRLGSQFWGRYTRAQQIVHIWRMRKIDMIRKYYRNSLKFRVLDRIRQLPGCVVLREDIEDMGSPRQISRCFESLVEIGELVRIGYGIYAKAYTSESLNRPIITGGFGQACKEALTKLGVAWEPGSAEQAYNAGLSTQVPVRTVVQLKSRFRGHLNYGNRKLIVEKGINAR
jgi:hypothetical protein